VKEVINETKEVVNWHSLGIQLGVKCEVLKKIEREYSGNDERCKTEAVAFWLQNTQECTWDRLIEAICGMEGHANLVERLMKTHQS